METSSNFTDEDRELMLCKIRKWIRWDRCPVKWWQSNWTAAKWKAALDSLDGFLCFHESHSSPEFSSLLEQFSIYIDRQLGRFTAPEGRWPRMAFSEWQLSSFPSQICCTVSSTSCYINSAQSVGEILQQVPEEGMLNNVNQSVLFFFFFFTPPSIKSGGFCYGLL